MSIRDSIASIATQEWVRFGRQEWSDQQKGGGGYLVRGHHEDENGFRERVGNYWREGVNNPKLDGADRNDPWSGAFVSWVLRSAGVQRQDFPFNASHSVYIKHAVGNRAAGRDTAMFVGWRIEEAPLRPGDLLGYDNAEKPPDVSYDNCLQFDGFRSHCDIVVARRSDAVLVIGGNVGHSVTLSSFRANASGILLSKAKPFFVVIRNNLG